MRYTYQYVKQLVILTLLIISFVYPLKIASADEGSQFSVIMVPNEKQIAESKGKPYYDLLLKPGEKTTVTIGIVNNSSETSNFVVMNNNALTNQNMIIDYSPINNSSKYLTINSDKYSDIVDKKDINVSVPANSSKKVSFIVRSPESNFSGKILGGVYVRKIPKEKIKNGYTNRFNFVTSIIIRQELKTNAVQLGLGKVKVGTTGKVFGIISNLTNNVNNYLTNLSVTSKLFHDSSSKKLVSEVTDENRSIAPTSVFNYFIPLKSDNLKTGKYIFDLTIKSKSTNQTWHWTKKININIRDSVVHSNVVKKFNNNLWLYILIFVLIMIIIILLGKRRKENEK